MRRFADFKLDDTMAKTPAAVTTLLDRGLGAGAGAGRARARRAAGPCAARGRKHRHRALDWRYYAEKQRRAEHDFDEAELKPYLQLDRMIEAAFDTAGRLFGLRFEPLADVAPATIPTSAPGR